MTKEQFTFAGEDGTELYATKYSADTPRGLVVVIHGMAEHKGRYGKFSRDLASNGYSVYVFDQRGHGETAVKNRDTLGHLSPAKGWENLVEDAWSQVKLVRTEEEVPVYLFGHSMGSFIVRKLITEHGEKLDGVVLSGSAKLNRFVLNLLLPLAKIEKWVLGSTAESKFIEKILFSSNNDPFQPTDTPYDWLSRDKRSVEEYSRDDHCGFSCTVGFYNAFVNGLKGLAGHSQYKGIPEDIPMLFVSGEEDPVGGPEVIEVAEEYSRAGVRSVEYKIYPEARHELFHEINRDKVISDLVNWLDSN